MISNEVKRGQSLLRELACRVLLIAIAAYFPIYSISLIISVPIHQIVAAFILVVSCAIYTNTRAKQLTLIAILAALTIKYGYSGLENLKYLALSLLGWTVISATVVACQASRVVSKSVLKVMLWVYFIVVCCIVILQITQVIPITIGGLQHEARVVSTFTNNLDDSIRPNGYFYHPYDLAVFLSPFLFILMAGLGSKYLLHPFLILFVALIKLKSLMVWVAMVLLTKWTPIKKYLHPRSIIIAIALLATITTITIIEYSNITLTAGRALVWRIYLLDYFNAPASGVMLGLKSAQTTINFNLYEDPLTHNQYVFIMCFGGVLFLALFVFLAYQSLREVSKKVGVVYAIYIMTIFLTLGLTGDLVILMPFWISASVLIMLNQKNRVSKV